jgi:hypothetical protein
MIASLLFSLVIAALSAIYTTAFGQSGRTFREGRTKLMASMSMRAIMRETSQATRIDRPSQNSYGRHLSGCSNAKADSTRIEPSLPATRFHFCVRLTNRGSGLCDGDPDAAPCLFYYSSSVSGNCPASNIVNDSNCGNSTTLGTPQLLASGLETLTSMPSNGYFSRRPSDFAEEDNAVRIAYSVTRPPGFNSPKLVFQVDTTASAHFGVRP